MIHDFAGRSSMARCTILTVCALPILLLVASSSKAQNGTGAQIASSLPTPPGATPAQVALGSQIFHGEIASAPCGGCHGTDGRGSPQGPDLTSGHWLWGDGSLAAIAHTIATGVPHPKAHGAPMPPMGGAQLSPAEVEAVAAYVWALGHRGGG